MVRLERRDRLVQLVDWSAAIWAGLAGGAVFFLMNLFVTPAIVGGNAWVQVRLLASIVMGPQVLAPPASFDAGALAAALVSNFALAIVFALLVAWVLHRWGLIVGIVGGALLGLALYLVVFYSLTRFFPQFFAMSGRGYLFSHLVFGAVVGGVYEALEVERFVPADDPPPREG